MYGAKWISRFFGLVDFFFWESKLVWAVGSMYSIQNTDAEPLQVSSDLLHSKGSMD